MDESQVVVPERLKETGGGLVTHAQLALNLALDPAAVADPDHDALEDVLLFHRENMLKDAELLPVPGQYREAEGGCHVGDLVFIVHNR